jgi:DNA-directed RNA polymerase specialized sigma24 family protein
MGSLLPSSVHDDKTSVIRVPVDLNASVLDLLQKHNLRSFVPLYVQSSETDDVVQTALTNVLPKLQSGHVDNLKNYLGKAIRNAASDTKRKHQHSYPLPLDENGELYQGSPLGMSSEGWRDPADVFEQKQNLRDLIAQIVDHILTLPPHQRVAVLCEIKNIVDDIPFLAESLLQHEVNIAFIQPPIEEKEKQRQRASLYAARKKLRSSREIYNITQEK